MPSADPTRSYVAKVAQINADPTLDDAAKAAAIEVANQQIVLQPTTGNGQAEQVLQQIEAYNAANHLTEDTKKVVRGHVFAWHGGQQPNAAQALVNVRIYSIGDVNNVKNATAALTDAIGNYQAVTASGGVSGTVPATLSLTLGPAASFGAFAPGADHTYSASTTAIVTSTAGDAALSASPATLANGTFRLAEPLVVTPAKASWTGPVSNDAFAIAFSQHIGANEPLRTGSYSATVTFTLSTTMP